MQQAGQVPYLDQNDAHEQSLGQSDGSLPGPEQTLNQSINQSITRRLQAYRLGLMILHRQHAERVLVAPAFWAISAVWLPHFCRSPCKIIIFF